LVTREGIRIFRIGWEYKVGKRSVKVHLGRFLGE